MFMAFLFKNSKKNAYFALIYKERGIEGYNHKKLIP